MTSFMAKCEKCGALIIPDTVCPNCHHSSRKSEVVRDQAGDEHSQMEEYRRRSNRYFTNYLIYMALVMGTGVAGMASAVGWGLLIFLGSLLGLVLVLVATPLAALAGWLLKVSGRLFPTELKCPACEARIDALGLQNGHCPCCAARLQFR